jgi:hypothetical protein
MLPQKSSTPLQPLILVVDNEIVIAKALSLRLAWRYIQIFTPKQKSTFLVAKMTALLQIVTGKSG